MKMRKLLTLVMGVSFFLAGSALAQASLLNEITVRGQLICGVNAGGLPGFASVDAQGNYSGFDVDFCRAIAAAVLGDADAVQYRGLSAQERFTAVQTGEVDILIRNTTWTSNRDTAQGLNFAPVTFFDGQGFMVRGDAGIANLQDFEGRRICVQSGTTTELNLADVMTALDVQYTPVIFENADQAESAYDDGSCDAYTTDRSGLVASRTRLRNFEEHQVLDVTISKEPLAPSVLHGDDRWYDAVKWIIYGLFNAEEYGITSENVESAAADSQDPNVRRMLGVEGNNVAEMGLPADGILQAIRQVGNYGEIYDRNLGPETQFDIPRGLNAQYYEGGIIYGMPFR
jgi:general L-amino acid transport system substrate-binding protein